MGKIVGKIVLTGGPCAGKTTALSRIEQELTDKGYHVLVVSESATELIKGGIRPFGNKAWNMIDFQRVILKYQLDKESSYELAVSMLPSDDECVILYDRGLLDNKAYITPDEFANISKEMGYEELDMMDSYDMVLHLVTAADGCPEYYTLENNQARSEGIEEAIRLDKRTQEAWTGHNRLVIIDNSTDFDCKMNRVLENIYQFLSTPYSIRYQKKFLVDKNLSDFSFLNKPCVNLIEIEQTYLEAQEGYEKRLRKRSFKGEETYYLTVQKKEQELSKIVTDKKITRKEYEVLLSMPIVGKVSKKRYTFVSGKQYFKLDFFSDSDICLLEVNPTHEVDKVNIPKQLVIEREVTNDSDFDNCHLAKKKGKIKCLK